MPKAKGAPLKKYAYLGDPLAEPAPPELMTILDRHRGQKDALITVMADIQRHYGYLPEKQLRYTARELGFPLAQVFGVATFYNLFQLKPPGRYQLRVCKGTACHVGHSDKIMAHIGQQLGIAQDEVTADKLFSLQGVACVGACSLAPVMMINDETHGRLTPEAAWEAIQQLLAEAEEQTHD
jgi:NADH:ubiquinone oxidoreductase subunit E